MYLFNNRRKYLPGASVSKRSIASASVTLPQNAYPYTGSAVTPPVTVRLGGALLAANEDYTVSYSDNTDVGMATVTVAGKGGYYGEASATFYVTSAASGWGGFEFTNLGSAAGSATLKDSGATYHPLDSINPFNIQVLPDGRLHFGGQLQGHAYVWGFDEGHPFDVSRFKASYDSRSPATPYFGSSVLCGGTSGYYSYYGGLNITPFTLSAAYDLSTRTGGTSVSMAANDALHMAFSADGMKFYHKPDGATLYCRSLSNPFTLASGDATASADLGTVTGEIGTWRDFSFSPDGRHMVAVSGSGTGRVHKFSLSTPWDVSTLSRTSYAALSIGYPEAVAVNDAGTKMIVFNADTDNKFYGYDLSA